MPERSTPPDVLSSSSVPQPPWVDGTIVRAAIHPAIGVARVGNSPDGYFIGPEVTDPLPEEPGFYRDPAGALKRQAARFRIYGYNAAGEVVRELTAGCGSIRWTVHVANKKAAWYQWQMALDVPEAATIQVPLRNADVKGDDRKGLVIDGGAAVDRRAEYPGPRATRSSDSSRGPTSTLGEVRTDARRPAPLPGRPWGLGFTDRQPDLQPVRPEWLHQRRRLVRRHVRRPGHRRGEHRGPVRSRSSRRGSSPRRPITARC